MYVANNNKTASSHVPIISDFNINGEQHTNGVAGSSSQQCGFCIKNFQILEQDKLKQNRRINNVQKQRAEKQRRSIKMNARTSENAFTFEIMFIYAQRVQPNHIRRQVCAVAR